MSQVAPASVRNINSLVSNIQQPLNKNSLMKASPPKSILLKNTSPTKVTMSSTSISTTQSIGGLQFVTADGKLVKADNLQLVSLDGKIIKPDSIMPSAANKTSPVKTILEAQPITNNQKSKDINTQKLLSSLQQPIPISVQSSPSAPLLPSSPVPVSIISVSRPPTLNLNSLQNIKPPTGVISSSYQPIKNLPEPKDGMMRVNEAKDMMLIKAVSPSKILPPPVPSTNIQSLLPTQPLLPSEVQSLSKNESKTKTQAKKPPKSKSVKETKRSKAQKLEEMLNLKPILSIVENKINRNDPLICDNSELETEFLNCLEQECRGESLTPNVVKQQKNFYKQNRKVTRYINFDIFSDEELSDDEIDEELHLESLIKSHQRKKSLKKYLLNPDPAINGKKILEMKGKSKPSLKGKKQDKIKEHLKMKRHQLWVSIIKKEIGKAGKARNHNFKEKQTVAKKLATTCMRVQRVKAMESQRAMKEAFWRAKRLTREMQAHWRKQQREEKQQKKAKEKAALEQRKLDVELLEAKRQQRKLNFLITQTELYAHFMAGKLGHESAETEDTILSKLDNDITDDRLKDIDDYDENETKAQVKSLATVATKKQEYMRDVFDQRCDSLKMSEAAEEAGDRPQPGIFRVIMCNCY